MAYAPHRSDLIKATLGPGAVLTLYREISGQTWSRRVTPNELLTPMEAAVALQVHRVTMYDWIDKGLLRGYESPHGTLLRWGEVYLFARNRGRPR